MLRGIWAWVAQSVHSYALIGTDGLPRKERSKRYAFSVMCLIATSTAISYTIFYAIYDFSGLWIAWVSSGLFTLVFFLPRLAKFGLSLALFVGMSSAAIVFTFLTYHLGAATGLYLFMSVGVLIAVLARGNENVSYTVALSVMAVGAMIASHLLFQEPSSAAAVDPFFQRLVFISVIISIPCMIGLGVFALSVRVARAEAALAAEHARSEALLDNLLPTEIAARLKSAPGEIIADDLPEVSILFADIVDFTPRASSMPADDVVRFLNEVFTEFDSLTDRLGLEKIKTIGDAYMVAAGMPEPRADHAEIVADMALAMLDVTARLTQESGQSVEVRIGIHTGAAIAGVIGTQKVFYDVWGDTVNTASRMESQGGIGRIQLTEEMKARLGDGYMFEPRGLIDIKGKGEIRTYWLTGKAAG